VFEAYVVAEDRNVNFFYTVNMLKLAVTKIVFLFRIIKNKYIFAKKILIINLNKNKKYILLN
jgi:hypothetical protein